MRSWFGLMGEPSTCPNNSASASGLPSPTAKRPSSVIAPVLVSPLHCFALAAHGQLSPVETMRVYKELSEIERAFASLRDIVEMRPIHHRTADRMQAHIFVASDPPRHRKET